jgi:alpha-L-rhamnosidase
VATQTTYPSYGYWINNGSTTLLEEWSGENSHNHQMFGSITEYFYKFLAGIQSPMEGNTTLGYKTIHIEPHVLQQLNYVNASLETVAGRVSSQWKKENDVFIHDVTIPANASATVVLPQFDYRNLIVFEGEEKIWENNSFIKGVSGISNVKVEDNRLVVDIGSGNYQFIVENK